MISWLPLFFQLALGAETAVVVRGETPPPGCDLQRRVALALDARRATLSGVVTLEFRASKWSVRYLGVERSLGRVSCEEAASLTAAIVVVHAVVSPKVADIAQSFALDAGAIEAAPSTLTAAPPPETGAQQRQGAGLVTAHERGELRSATAKQAQRAGVAQVGSELSAAAVPANREATSATLTEKPPAALHQLPGDAAVPASREVKPHSALRTPDELSAAAVPANREATSATPTENPPAALHQLPGELSNAAVPASREVKPHGALQHQTPDALSAAAVPANREATSATPTENPPAALHQLPGELSNAAPANREATSATPTEKPNAALQLQTPDVLSANREVSSATPTEKPSAPTPVSRALSTATPGAEPEQPNSPPTVSRESQSNSGRPEENSSHWSPQLSAVVGAFATSNPSLAGSANLSAGVLYGRWSFALSADFALPQAMPVTINANRSGTVTSLSFGGGLAAGRCFGSTIVFCPALTGGVRGLSVAATGTLYQQSTAVLFVGYAGAELLVRWHFADHWALTARLAPQVPFGKVQAVVEGTTSSTSTGAVEGSVGLGITWSPGFIFF